MTQRNFDKIEKKKRNFFSSAKKKNYNLSSLLDNNFQKPRQSERENIEIYIVDDIDKVRQNLFKYI